MKNVFPQWNSNSGPSAYEANALHVSVKLLKLIHIDHLKVTTFYLSVLLIVVPVPRGRSSKMFCGVIHFNNSLHSANVLISQTAKRYNYTCNIRKIHDKALLHQPLGAGNLHRKLRLNKFTFR